MYLVDYHTHSCCSFDSEESLLDEAGQAIRMGLRELCTTDHCDLIDGDGNRVYDLDWEPILAQYEQARSACGDSLKLRLGLELGCAQADPDCARKILSGAPLDFVIGSIHNQSLEKGGIDFYFLKYRTEQECYDALDDYFSSMARLVKLEDCYDVLGHIIYPLRYMKEAEGAPVTLGRYEDILREIFTHAAQAGRGIEVNTYCGRTMEEWLPVLKLYRACGGEILTVGSDAHAAENIGKGAREAVALMETAGFQYQTVYQGRVPQFIKL